MPLIEFDCSCGLVTEKILSFANSKPGTTITCPSCGKLVERVEFSRTLEPHFYGNPDGFSKPSPAKRYSTKLVSAKDGNKNSIG